MATTKKSTETSALSPKLAAVAKTIVKNAGKGGSVSEDEIQEALVEIDVDDNELTTLYNEIRNKGATITSEGDMPDVAVAALEGMGDLEEDELDIIMDDDDDDDEDDEIGRAHV